MKNNHKSYSWSESEVEVLKRIKLATKAHNAFEKLDPNPNNCTLISVTMHSKSLIQIQQLRAYIGGTAEDIIILST